MLSIRDGLVLRDSPSRNESGSEHRETQLDYIQRETTTALRFEAVTKGQLCIIRHSGAVDLSVHSHRCVILERRRERLNLISLLASALNILPFEKIIRLNQSN